jgi:UDP-glucose 4-epimerase
MLTSYARAYDFAAVSLRYFNVGGAAYGCGERHTTETHLIPIALQVAAGTREALTVYGEDYPTPDGTCVRDYVHVQDLAAAHLLALPAPAPGEHRIYNLGSGTGYSVQEMVDAVRRVTGHPLPVVVGDRRAGDPARLVASSAQIHSDLGWAPEHDLTTIVADAWSFAQKQDG